MRAIRFTSIAIISLACGGAFADGPPPDILDRERPAELTPAARALLDEFEFASRVQLSDDVPTLVHSDAFGGPLNGFELTNSSAIGRMIEVRRLSLLTLAEVGEAQLYFGVNSNGTLGLHFGASSKKPRTERVGSATKPYLMARKLPLSEPVID